MAHSVLTNALTLNELVYGKEKRPRNVLEWEVAANAHTQEVLERGSTSPLVWVLVNKGKTIPKNAIIAGEERRQPLYIARTFWEGGICIGKAGLHLERAVFAYNGKEFTSGSYEVLVPALQPLRYKFSESIHIPSIPRIMPSDSQAPKATVTGLGAFKLVVVVDDSSSMAGRLWLDAREALAGVVDLNGQDRSAEGIDVYFLNNPKVASDLRDGIEVRRLFDSIEPDGATPTGRKLQEIFEKYMPLIERKPTYHKPINVIVITDGAPSDDVIQVIVTGAQRLDRNGVPRENRPFGIQFVQIGDDEDAAEALKELDDDIADSNNIRDMVDTTPYNPKDPYFTKESMLKILLGGISSEYDSKPNSPYTEIRHPISRV